MEDSWINDRNKIIGLGDNSFKKSYYPELQKNIEELETSQENLEAIINSASDGILIHNLSGEILYLNKPAKTLLNIGEESKEPLTVMDISSPKSDISQLNDIWQTVRNFNPQTVEWIILQPGTRNEIPVQVSINNIRWNGQYLFVAVIRDFTVRKEYEEQLLKAKEQAEEGDRLKSAFLQNMSHEIRTPMNAIIGFSELLNKQELKPETRQEYTSIIVKSSKQLLSIVNNILTLSTIETKQERTRIEPVHINRELSNLLTIYNGQMNKGNVDIRLNKGLPDAQSEIYTDQTKFVQIVTNLLNNALKFTQNGTVEFGYTLKDNELEFYVRDNGIGISSEMHSKIFDRFFQASETILNGYGGAGLGLTISKEFVELLGGKIRVESEPGKGTTFYFTLKYQPVHPGDVPKETEQPALPRLSTILIAEDEDFNYLYLETVLTNFTSTLIRTIDGQATIEACKNNPDICLVLMDIRMPVLDGYSAAKAIKEFRPGLPIIAQSAYALEHEIKRFEGPAFDDYITKPINKAELYRKIRKFIRID